MSAHSKIGASSMHRWAECPASVRLSENLPPASTSSYAQEGVHAHEIAATVLLNKGVWPKQIPTDLRDAVKVYTDAVLASFKEEVGSILWVEQQFDLSLLYPGLFGTADAVIYKPQSKILSVWDYKHGQGIPVQVHHKGQGNVQLLYYALGAWYSKPDLGVAEVEICVVQPRCDHFDGPIRKFKISTIELLDFSDDLIRYAKATQAANAPFKAGEHCRFCPAAGVCPEIQKNALSLAKEEFKMDGYDADQLSKALNWLPVLESWTKSVREFAYAQAQHGNAIPGWKLVAKRAHRSWRDERNTIQVLKDQVSCVDTEIFQEPKLKTPAQMEKMLTKTELEIMDFQSHVTSVSSGLTLVPDTDSRPAVKCDAKTEFLAVE